MNLYADARQLEETLFCLVGKEEGARFRAAAEVKLHVEAAAREFSLERFARFENELFQLIFSYVDGNLLEEKIGGILAIRELISCTSASAETKVSKFAKSLSHALNINTEFPLLELIADALGHMARYSPVSQVDYLEGELDRALEWLRNKSTTHRRFASCEVLQQLAKNAPTIFFVRINDFFDLIWGAIWDHKEVIRVSAGRALSACLAVLRERTYHLQWYCFLYDQFQEGFSNGSEEYVHGSLLVVNEALKYTGDFMIPRFKEVCKAILRLKDHRSRVVRLAIISLLPSLAELCPDAFARAHIDESVGFLQKCAKTAELRPQALLSTGKLCRAVGPHLVSRIDELMGLIKTTFDQANNRSSSKHQEVLPEALLCVSDMVQGLGAPFHDRVLLLLEPMLQSGLTAQLIDTLSIISTYMPQQRPMVQIRLLEEATKVLGGYSRPAIVEPTYMYSWARRGSRPRGDSLGNRGSAYVPASLQRSQVSFGGTQAGGHRNASSLSMTSIHSTDSLLLGATATHGSSAVLGGTAGQGQSQNGKMNPFRKSISFLQNSFGGGKSSAQNANKFSSSGLSTVEESGMVPRTTQNANYDLVLLSLRTLASVSVPSASLIPLVQQSVLPYLASEDFRVRREAATTCARLLLTSTAASENNVPLRGPTACAMEEIIGELLEVVVADTSAEVRLAVLRSLGPDVFERFLARTHHIQTLLLLLSDELFEIKLEALSLLGRLAHRNPAAVQPPVRQQLVRLISEMKICPDHKAVEEAALMLCNFLRFSKFHPIVRPFMQTLIGTVPLLGDVRTTTAALQAIGELSVVQQQEILPYADELLPIIISNMLDSSSWKKKEVAVKTLGQFVCSAGLVVRPYLQYPQLLPKALDMLLRDSSVGYPHSLRMEIMRTLGLLGALEPAKYSHIQTYLQNHERQLKRNELMSEELQHQQQIIQYGHLTAQLLAGSLMAERDGKKDRERADSIVSTDKNNGAPTTALDMVHRGKHWRSGSVADNLRELLRADTTLLDDGVGEGGDAPVHLFMYEQSLMRSLSEPLHSDGIFAKINPSADEFYPRVAVAALVKVLRDPSLNVHHSTATQTIIQIFHSLGVRSVPFLSQIVPYFLQILKRSGPGLRESILQQLSQLVGIIGHHITPFLASIVEVLKQYWVEHLEYILGVVQQIAVTTTDAFDNFLPLLLPLLLSSLTIPSGVNYAMYKTNPQVLKPLEQTLNCLIALRSSLRKQAHLCVPTLCHLLTALQELSPHTTRLQTLAVYGLRCLCVGSRGAVAEQKDSLTSVFVHTLMRTISKASQAKNVPPLHSSSSHKQPLVTSGSILCSECVATLVSLARQIGSHILPFDKLIVRTLLSSTSGSRASFDITPYMEVARAIRNGAWGEVFADDEQEELLQARDESFRLMHNLEEFPLQVGLDAGLDSPGNESKDSFAQVTLSQMGGAGPQKLYLNQVQLARAWDVSQVSTSKDWNEWLWRFNVDLLRESPSPIMRACAPLAQSHAAMARELFHAAFVSCWLELSDQYQENLVRALQNAFRSPTVPAEILQSLLNLAEFMEHDVEALPISLSILAELAQKSHAYAKALHYRELEFQTNPSSACFESLININKKLDQYDAASGLLKVVEQIQKKFPELKESYTVQESWLAKLGHWDQALEKYDFKLEQQPRDGKALAGKMKCLEALGRWEEVIQLCEDHLDELRVESEANLSTTHTKAAVIGARAAWSLNEWTQMDAFVTQLPADNIDGCFMKAVLAVHAEDYSSSRGLIEQTREKLYTSITSLLTESYGRAYMPFIMVQQCAELEEITEYKILLKEAGLSEEMLPKDNKPSSPLTPSPTATASALATPTPQSNRQIGVYMDALHTLRSTSPGVLSRKSTPFAGGGAYPQMLVEGGGIPRSPIRNESMSRHLTQKTETKGRTGTFSGGSETLSSTCQVLRLEAQKRKSFLTEKWRRRIHGCYSSGRAAIPFWKCILNGRRMVLSEREDLDTWLDFVSLCRNGGNKALAERVLSMFQHAAENSFSGTGRALSGQDVSMAEADGMVMDRRIRLAMLKQKWAVGERHEALAGIDALIKGTPVSAATVTPTDGSFLNCLLKFGEWKLAMVGPGQTVDRNTRKDVLTLYYRATMVDPHSYFAWHQWGLSHYRAIEESRSLSPSLNTLGAGVFKAPHQQQHRHSNLNLDSLLHHAVNSIKGLMRALTLGCRQHSSSVTQDMLCVLSLWFRYGKIPEVCSAIEAGLATVHLDNWLGVLPQLIARIDHPDKGSRSLLHSLLARLGVKHAQALVYPLSVALKSPQGMRQEAAESLMTSLRQHSADLIDQALMVSQEMVRVAILWEENWHWSLEEASARFLVEGNVQGMLDILVPLHQSLEKGPTTLRESSFFQAYGMDLNDAWRCLQNYMTMMGHLGQPIPTAGAYVRPSNNSGPRRPEDELQEAWEIYYRVFKRINTQLPQILSLDLPSCSPALHSSQNLDLGVPGTYTVQGTAVRIRAFGPVVSIIRSKQRPRRFRIFGEDGQEYGFLLKGHEDLRQDERAMQLFGLVNALLFHDRRTGTHSADVSIQRYAAMPLSPTAGLISWVPNCDTFHDLIRSYRESRKIMLDVEQKLILQAAPGKLYDSLPAVQKLEVFEYALAFTTGEDLAKILWLKSQDSESWLRRRATYTRSLAVMSMVGYILGLGDRHPSNLMLDRQTGKVLHIDFGDCFEVAMHRDKYPEKVPFRLTRMLVNAMEVAGIEGNYRSTCEMVMTVLRENRDSLVATLEAFVHDPLVSWRLLNINQDREKTGRPVEETGTSGTTGVTSITESVSTSATNADESSEELSPLGNIIQQGEGALSGSLPSQRKRQPSINKGGVTLLEPIRETRKPTQESQAEPLNPTHESEEESEEETSSPRTGLIASSSNTGDSGDVEQTRCGAKQEAGAGEVRPIEDCGVSLTTRTSLLSADILTSSQEQGRLPPIVTTRLSPDAVGADTEEALARPGPVHTGSSGKSVSFSLVNQTVLADGEVRDSSGAVEIQQHQQPQDSKRQQQVINISSTESAVRASSTESIKGSGDEAPVELTPDLYAVISSLANSSSLLLDNPLNTTLTGGPSSFSLKHSLSWSSRVSHRGVSAAQAAAAAATLSESRADTLLGESVHTTQYGDDVDALQRELIDKAMVVIRRVMDKLTGLDFPPTPTRGGLAEGGRDREGEKENCKCAGGNPAHPPHPHALALDVPDQVDRLIREATSNDNLSLCFFGWCPFW